MDLSCYVAPWALPLEEVPVHLIWDSKHIYDHIVVNLPTDLEIKQFYNVESHTEEENGVRITELKSQGFFGFIIATKSLFSNLHLVKDFTVSFFKEGEPTIEQKMRAHFYRPKLKLLECPEFVTLSDDTNLSKLVQITMRLYGFGKVNISIDFNIGGGFETNPESLYRELIGRLLSLFKETQDEELNARPIRIDPKWLEREVQTYADRLNKGELPLDLDEHDLDDFREWIGNPENIDMLKGLLSRQMENILIDSLLFYFDRFPTDDVQLKQGRPEMHITQATENVGLRFRYQDSLQNDYEPIEFAVRVIDERQNKREAIKIPINIKWIKDRIVPTEEGYCD